MERIALPNSIEFTPGTNERHGVLTVEPLYPGYGTTIGNSLRRVLLSSLPGAAVTAVKIENAPHEFTTLPKVQEDILQIILNLKMLRLKVYTDEPVELKLSVKGEREVTAADIEKNSDVEIVNKDLKIATLTSKNAEIEMTIWVSRGRGYSAAETREKERRDIGTIAVDALFSPVHQVSIKVEPVRVGQMTNFDRLILDITTDGSITPGDAATEALKILNDHLAAISGGLHGQPPANETVPPVDNHDEDVAEEVAEIVASDNDEESTDDDTPKKGKKKSAKK